jgi:hypothetical protein
MVVAETPLSHDDLTLAFERAQLDSFDPTNHDRTGAPIGKQRRVKAVLTQAADQAPDVGGTLVQYLLQRLVGAGCFRPGTRGHVSPEVVENARAALRAAGYELHADGNLTPLMLESLSGRALSDALRAYVARARTGAADAALLAGTSKDLLEAVARHVLLEQTTGYNEHMPFPGTLLGAFQALSIAIDDGRVFAAQGALSTDPLQQVHESMYLLGVAVNRLRNSQGTGHGRPFPPSLSRREATTAAEAIGLVAGLLLDHLATPRGE